MCPFTLSDMNISETSWPIIIKFHLKHHWGGGLAALGFGSDRIRTLDECNIETFLSPVKALDKFNSNFIWTYQGQRFEVSSYCPRHMTEIIATRLNLVKSPDKNSQ